MPKWFHITVSVFLALLAIGKSILICDEYHWGYIPCAVLFVKYTFPAWFWNTTTDTLANKQKNRSSDLYIKMDENIID